MKILDECDAMVGLVRLFGFGVCVFKPMMDCDHKVSVLIECDVEYYWTSFIYFLYEYQCLWYCLRLAYPYLFVCMFVACAMIV